VRGVPKTLPEDRQERRDPGSGLEDGDVPVGGALAGARTVCDRCYYTYPTPSFGVHRRQFLAASAATAAAALAGCGSPEDGGGDDGDGDGDGGAETSEEPGGGYSLHGPDPAAGPHP